MLVENWNNALEAGAGALLLSIRKKQRFLITTKKKKKTEETQLQKRKMKNIKFWRPKLKASSLPESFVFSTPPLTKEAFFGVSI